MDNCISGLLSKRVEQKHARHAKHHLDIFLKCKPNSMFLSVYVHEYE